MTDEKYILELSSIDDWDWDECREYLVPCPNCGDVLKLEISPCTDTECCGIEHLALIINQFLVLQERQP
jgi:hypothetical protein